MHYKRYKPTCNIKFIHNNITDQIKIIKFNNYIKFKRRFAYIKVCDNLPQQIFENHMSEFFFVFGI